MSFLGHTLGGYPQASALIASAASCGEGAKLDIACGMSSVTLPRVLLNRTRTIAMRAGYIFITGCWALLSACTPLGFGLVDEPVNPVSEYIIGPGDTVNVFVYRSPELSAEVPVRPDGRISTPLAPDVAALGRT